MISRQLYLIAIIFFIPRLQLIAQEVSKSLMKPSIDSAAIKNWSGVGDANISNDGRFVWYEIRGRGEQDIIIKSTFGKYRKKIMDASKAVFTNDSKTIISKNSYDTLFIINLNDTGEKCIPNVLEYNVLETTSGASLFYKLKGSDESLIVEELVTQRKIVFKGVTNYLMDPTGQCLITKRGVSNTSTDSLFLFDVMKWSNFFVWSGKKPERVLYHELSKKVAILVNEKSTLTISILRLVDKHEVIHKLSFEKYSKKFIIKNIIRFSNNGHKLFVQAEEYDTSIAISGNSARVDIWHFQDKTLQSQQLLQKKNLSYVFSCELDVEKWERLQYENEEIKFSLNDSFALITKNIGGTLEEWNWNKYSSTTNILLNTFTGERTVLLINGPSFFPNAKCLYGTSSAIPSSKNDIVIYNIRKRSYRNITSELPLQDQLSEIPSASSLTHNDYSIRGFVDSNNVLVRDQNDVWMISLLGKGKPVNITNGYGKANNLRFNIVLQQPWSKPFMNGDTVILKAFDKTNKEEGFYFTVLGANKNPIKLVMKSWRIADFYPKKAKDVATYLIKCETSSASPNFFTTNDLKTFFSLTNERPEVSYNWISSELIRWKSFDGNDLQGIVYKPENFDPRKKYPVIFHFYETLSHKLNEFKTPDFSSDDINIPWFVSNGYIVCTPDIVYKIGSPGPSAYNSIVSCAKYLITFPWVDAKRLGLQGHSYGGFEANYILTHSHLFAAAVSTSGPTDLISEYNSTLGDGKSRQFVNETHQARLGSTLWADPTTYISNSPIFYANKVTTPILLMHNKADRAVPFSQGLEFFLAFRRLGKRAWLLQYDDGGHSLYPGTNAKADYTFRMMQFFDHYLKDSAAPKWMLYGVEAKNKGMEIGYELVREKDKNGKWITPQEGGLLNDEEKKKVEALKKRKPVTIKME